MTLKYSSACCSVGPSERYSVSLGADNSCFDCSLSTGGLESDGYLEGVVDPPLETSEGTDHEDSGAEALPETVEADAGVDLASGATTLVHDGDHGVSRVRHDSAEDTSEVT